jgi:hypothetical protein
MLGIILIGIFFAFVAVMAGCEIYVESLPEAKFSKWWRHNVIAKED